MITFNIQTSQSLIDGTYRTCVEVVEPNKPTTFYHGQTPYMNEASAASEGWMIAKIMRSILNGELRMREVEEA